MGEEIDRKKKLWRALIMIRSDVMSRTGLGIELVFLGIGLDDQDVFINEAIARRWFAIQDVGRGVNYLQDMSSFYT